MKELENKLNDSKQDFNRFGEQLELFETQAYAELEKSPKENVYSCDEDFYKQRLEEIKSQDNYKIVFVYDYKTRTELMKKLNQLKKDKQFENISQVFKYLLEKENL
jgi:hypothetical protein